jgi:hypothetical protein
LIADDADSANEDEIGNPFASIKSALSAVSQSANPLSLLRLSFAQPPFLMSSVCQWRVANLCARLTGIAKETKMNALMNGKVQPAPSWLKKRNAALRRKRVPTSNAVERQFRAAEAGRMKYDVKPPHSAPGRKLNTV